MEDIKEEDSDEFDFVQQDGDSDNDGGTVGGAARDRNF